MKTIKTIIATASLVLVSCSGYAQLYVTAGAGYGFGMNKQLIAVEYESTSTQETFRGVYGSFGQGIQPSLNVGYMLCQWGGIEIGYSYLMGSKMKVAYDDHGSSTVTTTGEDQLSASMSRIFLGGRFAFGENSLRPYMRMGLLLGMGGKIIIDSDQTMVNPVQTFVTKQVTEYDGGVALGVAGSFGITYNVSDAFGIYVEASMVSQSWAPEHSIITTYTVNGDDQLSNMNTRDKETNYVDVIVDNGGSPNDNEPDQDLLQPMPFSSLGISIGIQLTFGQ